MSAAGVRGREECKHDVWGVIYPIRTLAGQLVAVLSYSLYVTRLQ